MKPTKADLLALLRSRDHQLEDLCRANRSLERDNKLLREISLGMPGVKVVKTAMARFDEMCKKHDGIEMYLAKVRLSSDTSRAGLAMIRACARLAKHREKT